MIDAILRRASQNGGKMRWWESVVLSVYFFASNPIEEFKGLLVSRRIARLERKHFHVE